MMVLLVFIEMNMLGNKVSSVDPIYNFSKKRNKATNRVKQKTL